MTFSEYKAAAARLHKLYDSTWASCTAEQRRILDDYSRALQDLDEGLASPRLRERCLAMHASLSADERSKACTQLLHARLELLHMWCIVGQSG